MRPIDADALKDKANDTDYMPTGKWLSLSDLDAAPTIEPKRGKWIYTEVRKYPLCYNLAKCSNCGWSHHSRPGEKWILTAEDVATSFKYCPHCGARMEVNNLLKSE